MKWAGYAILWGLIFWTVLSSSVGATPAVSLDQDWGLSPLHSIYRHPAEGIQILSEADGTQVLQVMTWYEDLSITRGAAPDRRLYCRFMHSLLFGRNILRSSKKALPPSLAFSENPKVDLIRFSFFAVLYKNQPTSPFWDQSPAPPPANTDPNAQLRVTWRRQEILIPYLSVDLTRAEWKSLEQFLQGRSQMNYSSFRRELCEPIFKLMPDLRSNFSALTEKNQN